MEVLNKRAAELTVLGVEIPPGESKLVPGLKSDHMFIRSGWLKPVSSKPTAPASTASVELYKAKHKGGRTWGVEGPNGLLADFSGSKEEAFAHAKTLNEDAANETR